MKFNLIESHSKDAYECYDDVKQDLIDGMMVKEVKEKYDISDGQWLKFRRELIKEGIIKSRQRRKNEAKYHYWHKTKKRWFIERRIDGKMTFFAMVKTKSQCDEFINKLNKYGWNKSNIPQIKREMGL